MNEINSQGFSILPDELKLLILRYLDMETLGRVSHWGKDWKKLSEKNDLWKNFLAEIPSTIELKPVDFRREAIDQLKLIREVQKQAKDLLGGSQAESQTKCLLRKGWWNHKEEITQWMKNEMPLDMKRALKVFNLILNQYECFELATLITSFHCNELYQELENVMDQRFDELVYPTTVNWNHCSFRILHALNEVVKRRDDNNDLLSLRISLTKEDQHTKEVGVIFELINAQKIANLVIINSLTGKDTEDLLIQKCCESSEQLSGTIGLAKGTLDENKMKLVAEKQPGINLKKTRFFNVDLKIETHL